MANVDLQLSKPRTPANTDLAFGASAGSAPDVDVTGHVTMPGLVVLGMAAYDPNVWRGLTQTAILPFEQAEPMSDELGSTWKDRPTLTAQTRIPWAESALLCAETTAPWVTLETRSAETRPAWDMAEPLVDESMAPWLYPDRLRAEDVLTWDKAAPLFDERAWHWKYPPRAQTTRAHAWDKAHRWFVDPRLIYDPMPTRRRDERVIPWEQGLVLVSLWPRPDVYVPPVIPPRVITPDLNFECPTTPDTPAWIAFGRSCGTPPGQIIIPILRTYIVIHDITVLRLPDNYPIHASRVSLSIDADAWAWTFSATLLGKEALDAVLPSTQGEPVTLVIHINGHDWHVLVENWSENREFGQRGVSVQGRGISAWLSAPYNLPASGETTQARTVQQLMGDHIPLGSGASVAWTSGMADWLVPAGAWTWQNLTPVQAIHKAAQEVGMVVHPDKASQVLTIQPRYPVLPWDYASATPNLIIPDVAILQLQRQQAINTQANAVYVHGGDTGGILAQVKRLYSAGDRVAPVQSSSLITHVDGARLLGSRILAGQHQQPEVRSVTLPMGGVFALGEVGQLLRAEVDSVAHHGIINSVAIEAARSDTSATVRQTLTVGEETANQWTKFKRLLPYDPLLIGTIEQLHSDGTATVLMLGGGTMRVRGSGTIGQAVYVRSGMIEGQAPQLAQVMIEV